MGGFGGRLGVTLCLRFRALCGGCGGVLGGQSVQYAAAVFGGDGLLQKGLELLLGQRDGVGQQLLDKPHALAEAVCPVLALLDQPLFAPFAIFSKKVENYTPQKTSQEVDTQMSTSLLFYCLSYPAMLYSFYQGQVVSDRTEEALCVTRTRN